MSSASAESIRNESIAVENTRGWRRFLAFSGPAYLVSVGYMDPGNWAADLEGGARFGYQLLWVLVLSNLMAILLQTLSARLGIATGRDLAQSCRERYPRPINLALWVLSEIAIAACDLAEVLGAAIGLKLLFGIPLLLGVVLTAADTLLILSLSRYGIRIIERIVFALVLLIGGCFAFEIALAKPALMDIARGLAPSFPPEALYVVLAMLGATVMPHNLYLHSSLVQTRAIGDSAESKRRAARFNFFDSTIALNGALLVNASILILSAAVFHQRGIPVTRIEQAHELLAPSLGSATASILFAVALIASGQSSTMTGTLAGQIVMEGFLNLRMRPWLRRLLTRLLAISPAIAVIALQGEAATYQLLILSQVILSIQLPFAIVPLIQFTGDAQRMGVLASPSWLKGMAWVSAALIVGLNVWLVGQHVGSIWSMLVAAPLAALLLWLIVEPRLRAVPASAPVLPAAPGLGALDRPGYRSILVPLDHSDLDAVALTHAAALAKAHGARVLILHVEEGPASRVYGEMAGTAEEREGSAYLRSIQERFNREDIVAETLVEYSGQPADAIVRVAAVRKPDLVVMGGHGHGFLKDIVFGSTIETVRHHVKAPLLVVRKGS